MSEPNERRTTTTTLTQRVEILEREIEELRSLLSQRNHTQTRDISETERAVIANIARIRPQDAIVFSYRIDGPQTKDQLRKKLDLWGIAYGTWFDGGNFNNRLLKTGIIKVDGENENGEQIYSLTMKGEQIADEKLARLHN